MTGQSLPAGVHRQPSDRAAVVREVAESAAGSLEPYYWMFGQYDGAAVFNLPDSQSMAAVSLAITSSPASSDMPQVTVTRSRLPSALMRPRRSSARSA